MKKVIVTALVLAGLVSAKCDGVKPKNSINPSQETLAGKTLVEPKEPTWCETHSENDTETNACKYFIGEWANPWHTNNTFTIREDGSYSLVYNSGDGRATGIPFVTMEGEKLRAEESRSNGLVFHLEKTATGIQFLGIEFEKVPVTQKTGTWCKAHATNTTSDTNAAETCKKIEGTWTFDAGNTTTTVIFTDKGEVINSKDASDNGIAYKYENRKVFFRTAKTLGNPDIRIELSATNDTNAFIKGYFSESVSPYTKKTPPAQ